ncbi:MAG: HipA family kinase [Bacteroidota bacterium]
MKQLHSIESIEPHHVIDTGCRPLLVHTNELEDYLVKYVKGTVPAQMLAREFIAAEFCKLWKIPFPEVALVQIKDEHLSPDLRIGTTKLETPGFGTKYDRTLKELDKLFDEMTNHQSNKFINKDNFLIIALFDIWMSNDDRSSGNYNMMVKSIDKGYEFWAIDHGAVFHTGNQDKKNYPISLEDSVLNSPLLLQLFTSKQLYNNQTHDELENFYYLRASDCKNKYHEIINSIPEKWNIDKPLLIKELTGFMMHDEWFKTCWQTFLEFLQRIKNR